MLQLDSIVNNTERPVKITFKVALLGLLAGLPFTTPSAYAAHPPCSQPQQALKQWQGFANLMIDIETYTYSAPAAMAIRTQAEYERFISYIPTRQLTKKQPAPPSQDPLLAKPRIDFSQHMLLVMFRDDSIVGPINLCGLSYTPTHLKIRVQLPPLGDKELGMARPTDVGSYLAVLVPRFDGEVLFNPETTPSSR